MEYTPLNSGQYTSAQGYKIIDSDLNTESDNWDWIWKIKSHPKIKLFI